MSDYKKIKEQEQVYATYAKLTTVGMGIDSGIPFKEPETDLPEYQEYYEKLAVILDGLGHGFPRPEEMKGEYARMVKPGTDIDFLKTYWLPEHVVLGIHVPIDRFTTAAEVAEKAGISEEEALKKLMEMANRVCVYHKIEDGVDYFRHVSPFPGQGAMSVGRMTGTQFWGMGLEPYMQYYLRPAMYDKPCPSWRYLPLTDNEIAQGEKIEDYEVAERMLLNADKVSVTSCICRAPIGHCDQTCAPFDVCLQLNDFADFYVNDLKVSRYMTKDEVKAHIERCKKEQLAILTSGCKEAGIMCSCCRDGCCAPTEFFKKYGMNGPYTGNVTHFVVKKDTTKCNNCGRCVEACFTQKGHLWEKDSVVYYPNQCVGCGLCVRECPHDALILKRKPEDKCFDYPSDEFEEWIQTADGDYGIKLDYVERGRGTK